jgi:hypothetical protein
MILRLILIAAMACAIAAGCRVEAEGDVPVVKPAGGVKVDID